MKKIISILLVCMMILPMTVCFTGCDIDIIIDKDGDDNTPNTDSTTNNTNNAPTIIKYELNEKGELIATYSDGTVVNLGVIVGGSVEDLNNNNNNNNNNNDNNNDDNNNDNNNNNNNNNNGDNNNDNNNNDPYEKDDLPALNYSGDTLTILYWSDNPHNEFNITEPSGDIVSNAVYTRDRTVKQRLNIQLDYVGTPGWQTAPFVQFLNRDVFSGACEYDIACSASVTIASCATNNLCKNLLDYDYINFDKPWWPDALIEEATINRKLYFASGDISTSYIYEMYINFYNLDMVQEYKLTDDFTQLALAGKWTWDKFYEFSNAVGYNEDNGDNIPSNGDIFGFIIETSAIDCAFYSADLHMFSHDNTGGISVDESCFSAKADGFVADLNDFIHRSGSVYYTVPLSEGNDDANDTQKSSKWMFSRGEALFIFGRAIVAKDVFAHAEGLNYGILPIPKYNEDQEQYVSTLTNQFTLYSISIGSHDAEMASAAIECMASESYRQVTPVLFETIMKLRYAPSAASAQIYDIVRATTTFDLSRIFHRALESIPEWVFRKAIENDESWGAQATSATRTLNRLIEAVIMSAFTS